MRPEEPPSTAVLSNPGPPSGPRKDRPHGAAGGAGGAGDPVWLLLEFGHLYDRYNVNAVSGPCWLLQSELARGALSAAVRRPVVCGTRTMPVRSSCTAGAISVGGRAIGSRQVVDFLSSAVLILVLVAVSGDLAQA